MADKDTGVLLRPTNFFSANGITGSASSEKVDSSYASLAVAVSTIGSTPSTLLITSAHTLAADLTIPSTLSLRVIRGGSITATGYTLTINGSFESDLHQVFIGSGSVVFGLGSTSAVEAKWFGSDGAAVQKAVDAGATYIKRITAAPGVYLFDAPLQLPVTNTEWGIHISGNKAEQKYQALPGSWSTVFRANSAIASIITNRSGSDAAYYNVVENVVLDAENKAAVGYINGYQDSLVNCAVIQAVTAGVDLGALTNSSRITDCTLALNAIGLRSIGVNTTTFNVTRTRIRQNTGDAIYLSTGLTASFDDCIIESNGGIGANLKAAAGANSTLWNVAFNSCWFESNTGYDLDAGALGASPAKFIRLSNCFFNSGTKCANLGFVYGVTFDACHFLDSVTTSGYFVVDSTALYITLFNCPDVIGDSAITITGAGATLVTKLGPTIDPGWKLTGKLFATSTAIASGVATGALNGPAFGFSGTAGSPHYLHGSLHLFSTAAAGTTNFYSGTTAGGSSSVVLRAWPRGGNAQVTTSGSIRFSGEVGPVTAVELWHASGLTEARGIRSDPTGITFFSTAVSDSAGKILSAALNTVQLADGGTGATTAAGARTSLGLGTLATQSGTFSGTSSGTNTGDQNLFGSVVVSGQPTVTAASNPTPLTLVAGSGVTLTTDNTAKSITITAPGGGSGDASTNTSTSVDSEVALFSSTGGKTLKRATGTGLARLASGVLSAAELSGDLTTSGSNVATLATVNSNVGTYGSATAAPQITINAKGLVTAGANITITPAISSLTGAGSGVLTAAANATNGSGGFMTTDGVKALTNTTFDAAATGNVLKCKSYIYLTHPHLADGTGATLGTTATAIDYGHATFSNSADETANYVEYYLQVPEDIDTSVALRARIKVRLGGADTATQRYVLSSVSVADSAVPTASTLANAINIDFAGDGSGASGDVETSAWTTLTSWAGALTAGQTWRIRFARDGNASQDASTVNSTELGLVLEYGITQ